MIPVWRDPPPQPSPTSGEGAAARSSRRTRPSRTRCAIISSVAIPNSKPSSPSLPARCSVALGVSASRGEAFARVSLFSALNFAAHLGTVEADSDRTVTTHIDPQARHPPSDIAEFKEDSLVFDVPKPESGTVDLWEMIRSGRAQKSLQLLFNKIHKWQLEQAVGSMLGELILLRELDKNERNGRVRSIVDREGQRVLNLITHAANQLRPLFESDPLTRVLLPILTELTTPDAASLSRLSTTASDVLEAAKAKFAEDIGGHLSDNDLNFEQLAMLFGGQRGLGLVLEVLRNRVFARL